MHPSRTRAVYAAIAVLVAVGITTAAVRWLTWSQPHARIVIPSSPPARTGMGPSPAPSWSPGSPSPATDVRLAWAHLDSIDGYSNTGGDQDMHPLDGLATPAIVQDFLNEGKYTAERTPSPNDSSRLYSALHGDQADVDWVTEHGGGRDTVMKRVINSCSLSNMKVAPPRGTALDVARLAACLREGAIAQPEWANWVVEEMRATTGGIGAVRGTGDGQRLAQHNSTVRDGDRYRTGCMAVGAYWSAAVLVDYPADRGEGYGLTVCADTARTAFPPDTQRAPENESPAPTGTMA